MDDTQKYKRNLAQAMVDQYEEGRISRRHMLKTVGQILGVAIVSPTLLASLGCSTLEASDEEQEAASAPESDSSGARLVARAWNDPAFKARLLSDTTSAAAALGIDTSGPIEFVTLENTLQVHNLVVCTLCSCYPEAILGSPPDWYKSDNYRSRALLEPRALLSEFGLDPGEDKKIAVHDSTYEIRYLVLPMRPHGTAGMSEEKLTQLVTRDCLIGVEVP